MPEDVMDQMMERYEGQLSGGGAPWAMPESLAPMIANIQANPPNEDLMRKALSFYLQRYDFPELQTALQQAGVGAYDSNPSEVVPAGIEQFMRSEVIADPEERERQARIFLSMLQGG